MLLMDDNLSHAIFDIGIEPSDSRSNRQKYDKR